MNPNEREQLTRFLEQLRAARVSERDGEADRMIRDAVTAHTDAAYMLVQRAMLLEQALNHAKAQISQLQQQVAHSQESQPGGGFLSGNNPWAAGAEPTRDRGRVPGGADYQPPRAAASPAATGGGSSFLGNLATTAAGVVAGSFLFQGIENLLGHRSGASGFEPAMDPVAENTTINNYYGSDAADDSVPPDDPDEFLADHSGDFGDDGFFDSSDDSSWV